MENLLDVGAFKVEIFLTLIILGLSLIYMRGPVILLYLFSIFGWYGGHIKDWGPLTLLFSEMALPEFAILGAFVLSFGNRKNPRIPFLGLLMLFWLSCAYVWSFGVYPEMDFAVQYTRKCVILPVLAHIAAYRLLDSPRKRELMMSCMIGGVTLICLMSISMITGILISKSAIFMPTIMSGRYNFDVVMPVIGGVSLGGNIISVYAAMAAATLFVVLQSQPHLATHASRLAIASMTTAAGVIFAGGGRMPVVAVVATISIVTFCTARRRGVVNIYSWVIGLFGLMILMNILSGIGLMSDVSAERIRETIRFIDSPITYFLQSNHGENWQAFLEVAPHYLLGAGFFTSMAAVGGQNLGPHSQFGYLYLGTGCLGMLIYFGILIWVAVRGLRQRDGSPGESTTVIACSAGIITYLFSCVMVHTVLVHGADCYAYIMAAIVMRQIHDTRKTPLKKSAVPAGATTRQEPHAVR